MNEQTNKILKETIEELLLKMDFTAMIEIDDSHEGFLAAKIESDEAGILIGQGGENLAALQHLIRALVNKKMGSEPLNFIVDVNNYKEYRLELLKEMALGLARQVIEEKKAQILEPMSAYERRVVHLALKELGGVVTESQGEGPERRIVIKPGSEDWAGSPSGEQEQ